MADRHFSNLKLNAIAIGSLPHNNTKQAMDLVKKDFQKIPFFPQLSKVNKNEDMDIQILEGMPSFFSNKSQSFFFDTESENFYQNLEEFFSDYEEITNDINSTKLEKYAISENFSSTFPYFEQIIRENKPQYAKGQIIGPFTLSSILKDQNNISVIFDETLTDIVQKQLILKVLWQIRRIKQANETTIPIIFMDEPTLSQIGTTAFLSINESDIIKMLKEISDIIKKHGGISAIHCCGKCDWRIPIESGIDIINFDAYNYSKNFSIYHKAIKTFLEQGGKIAWGLVPTTDGRLLADLNVKILEKIFTDSVKYLTKKGLDEKLIIDNSLITSSCGAGSLSVKDSQKAMDLLHDLSEYLTKRY